MKDQILDTIAAALASTLSVRADRRQASRKTEVRRRARTQPQGLQAPLSA